MTDDKYPVLRYRASPDHRAKVERKAKRAGISVSAWLRSTIEAALDAPQAPPVTPDPVRQAEAFVPRHELPHIVQGDGTCAGGCDPDVDRTCTVGPDDPRRGRKRR